ncbi:hypothetical protein [Arthrobacter sp. HY1533]|uniref:hypothetical protein n=1 Tax=Arthrobacter sp. HY1533 TaxID=2970919 RepID=UPI0022B9DD74|nr:hypothetical protein [Arthrobacter sp. HY1533]
MSQSMQEPLDQQAGSNASPATQDKPGNPYLGLFIAVGGYAVGAIPILGMALLGLLSWFGGPGPYDSGGNGFGAFMCVVGILGLLSAPALLAIASTARSTKMWTIATCAAIPAVIAAFVVYGTIAGAVA